MFFTLPVFLHGGKQKWILGSLVDAVTVGTFEMLGTGIAVLEPTVPPKLKDTRRSSVKFGFSVLARRVRGKKGNVQRVLYG